MNERFMFLKDYYFSLNKKRILIKANPIKKKARFKLYYWNANYNNKWITQYLLEILNH